MTDPSATASMDDVRDVEKGSPVFTPRSSDSMHHSCSHTKLADPTCSRRCFKTLDLSDFKPTPHRLLKAVPAVTLGAILNLLDVVSTGMLIFPSASDPLAIWLGMAVYMMSIVSFFLSKLGYLRQFRVNYKALYPSSKCHCHLSSCLSF